MVASTGFPAITRMTILRGVDSDLTNSSGCDFSLLWVGALVRCKTTNRRGEPKQQSNNQSIEPVAFIHASLDDTCLRPCSP